MKQLSTLLLLLLVASATRAQYPLYYGNSDSARIPGTILRSGRTENRTFRPAYFNKVRLDRMSDSIKTLYLTPPASPTTEFSFASTYFDDGAGGTFSGTALRNGNVLYGLLDDATGQAVTYTKVTTKPVGGSYTNADVDGRVIRKKGSEFFALNIGSIVFPEWFGAVGNRVTNDSVAFVKAIKYIQTRTTGGTLRLTADKSYLVGTLNLPVGLSLDGLGELYKTTVKVTGTGNPYSTANARIADIRITWDVLVIGDTSLRGRNGIELQQVRNVVIDHVTFNNVNNALFVPGLDLFQQVNRSQFINNIVISANRGIYIQGRGMNTNTYEVGDLNCSGNYFYGGIQYRHMEAYGLDGLVWEGNTCFFPARADHNPTKAENIFIYHLNWGNISNSQLFEAGADAVRIIKYGKLTITNLNIAWPGQRTPGVGIHLSNQDNDPTGEFYRSNPTTISNVVIDAASRGGVWIDSGTYKPSITNLNTSRLGQSFNYYGDLLGGPDLSTVDKYTVYADSAARGVFYEGVSDNAAITFSLLAPGSYGRELNSGRNWLRERSGTISNDGRPDLVAPANYLENLLASSSTLTDWTASGTTATLSTTVYGLDSARTYKIDETATTATHRLQAPTYTRTDGAVAADYTFSGSVMAGERSLLDVYITDASLSGGILASFDLASGERTAIYSNSPFSSYIIRRADIVKEGGGWYRLIITAQIPAGVTTVRPVLYLRTTPGGTAPGIGQSYAGTAGSGLYAYNMQLNLGSYATPYVATSPRKAIQYNYSLFTRSGSDIYYSAGKVGIGSTAFGPATLNVTTSSTAPLVQLRNPSTEGKTYYLFSTNATNSSGGGRFLVNDTSSTVGVVPLAIYDDRIAMGGNTPDTSAALHLISTTKGFLKPRMTTAQRDLITTPALGLEIFSTTDSLDYHYNGTAWVVKGDMRKAVYDPNNDGVVDSAANTANMARTNVSNVFGAFQEFTGDVRPSSSTTYNLGSATRKWNSGFINTINSQGTLTLSTGSTLSTSVIRFQHAASLNMFFISGTSGKAVFQEPTLNTTAINSAQLAIVSTTGGLLPPQMTETQMRAIAFPASGLLVGVSDYDALFKYSSDRGRWEPIGRINMTSAQRTAFPAYVGMEVYQTDGTTGVYLYQAGAWTKIH